MSRQLWLAAKHSSLFCSAVRDDGAKGFAPSTLGWHLEGIHFLAEIIPLVKNVVRLKLISCVRGERERERERETYRKTDKEKDIESEREKRLTERQTRRKILRARERRD